MATIAFSTGSLHTYGISRAFELAAEAGFEAVEVLIDHRWDSRQPAYLKRLSRESGLPIVAVHSPFVPHVPGWPSDPLGRLQHSAALARELKAGIVVAHLPLRIHAAKVEFFGLSKRPLLLPVPFPVSSDYRRFLLNGLDQFEADEEVLVGVENIFEDEGMNAEVFAEFFEGGGILKSGDVYPGDGEGLFVGKGFLDVFEGAFFEGGFVVVHEADFHLLGAFVAGVDEAAGREASFAGGAADESAHERCSSLSGDNEGPTGYYHIL